MTNQGAARMTSIIEFLEKMGSECQWHEATREELDRALGETDIEEPVRRAILDQDAKALQVLLHQSPLFGTMLPSAPDEEEEEGEEPNERPEPKDARMPYASCSLLNA